MPKKILSDVINNIEETLVMDEIVNCPKVYSVLEFALIELKDALESLTP